MELTFTDCSQCKNCPLWESATNPGLPTRPFAVSGKDTALLIVGEAPGYNEDTNGKSWIGYSGQLLEKFIGASKFADYADVYLSNACRCKPAQAANVTNGQVSKCRKNLIADIHILYTQYKHVIILACGKPATLAISGLSSLNQAFHHQGIEGGSIFSSEVTPAGNPTGTQVPPSPVLFFAYHPAILHPKRKPALVSAVQAHFGLVRRYLTGEFIPNALQALPEVGVDPDILRLPNKVGLDIETYGILKTHEQTVFHPVQSKVVDGIDFKDQIVTVCFGFEENGHKRTCLYVWENESHRQMVAKWFAKIVREKIIVSGHNVKFDLLYLSYADPTLNYWISPQWLKVDDTMILSFLFDDQQPEKGLKQLSTLYGIAEYGDLTKIYDENRAEDAYDPKLHKLNCLDVASHLTIHDELLKMIENRYGKKSPKLAQASADMRNQVIWCCLEMERVGCAMDRGKLQAYHDEAELVCAYEENLLRTAGIIPEGKGSDKSKRELMGQALMECGLLGDKRVEMTPKAKKLSYGLVNINLILEYLDKANFLYRIIESFKKFGEWEDIIDKYTFPLLYNKKKGLVIEDGNRKTDDSAGRVLLPAGVLHSVGVAYPSWYPVPSYIDKNDAGKGKAGGTKQGRITCQRPPLQTGPERIYGAITTRFNPGILRSYDFDAIEIRIAALLSGDSLMLEWFQKGLKPHIETLKQVFPELDLTGKSVGEIKGMLEYKSCKAVNFLVMYKGGENVLQETVLKDTGTLLDIEFCHNVIVKWYRLHPVFKEWQEKLVDEVGRKGYLEVLTGWGRTFTSDPTAIASQINDICNFKIQTLGSGQIPESSQFKILLGLREKNLRSIIPLNTYDSLLIDGPPDELEEVDAIVADAIKHPPLYELLCKETNRYIPLEYERKEICRYGC